MSLRQLLLSLVQVPALCSHAIEDVHFLPGGGRIFQALISFCSCKLPFVSRFYADDTSSCLRSAHCFLPTEGKPAGEVIGLILLQLVIIRVGRTCQIRRLSQSKPQVTEGKKRDA